MWTRQATTQDLTFCLSADAAAGIAFDRTRHFETAIAEGGCLIAGRWQNAEGVLVSSRSFFSRPFISLLYVVGSARRSGVAFALLEAVEAKHAPDDVFTSTNQSNEPMQKLLQKRGYLAAGVVLHLDPGDPELIFVKKR